MTITLTGRYKSNGLMDELLDRFPEWRGDLAPPELGFPPGCRINPKLGVQSKGDTVWLTVPEDADLDAIHAVVAAHDPDAETKGQRGARERREAIARVKARDPDLAKALGL